MEKITRRESAKMFAALLPLVTFSPRAIVSLTEKTVTPFDSVPIGMNSLALLQDGTTKQYKDIVKGEVFRVLYHNGDIAEEYLEAEEFVPAEFPVFEGEGGIRCHVVPKPS